MKQVIDLDESGYYSDFPYMFIDFPPKNGMVTISTQGMDEALQVPVDYAQDVITRNNEMRDELEAIAEAFEAAAPEAFGQFMEGE